MAFSARARRFPLFLWSIRKNACPSSGGSEKRSICRSGLENIRLFNEAEEKIPQADLVVRLQAEELLRLVRDNGKTLSSIEVEEGSEEFTNLKMLHAIAKKMDYSRTLGLNSTAVTLERMPCS